LPCCSAGPAEFYPEFSLTEGYILDGHGMRWVHAWTRWVHDVACCGHADDGR